MTRHENAQILNDISGLAHDLHCYEAAAQNTEALTRACNALVRALELAEQPAKGEPA